MKLKNKKTGEIVEFDKGKIILDCKDGKTIYFNSVEDLENWEDYEETKGWYIDISCVARLAEPFFGAKNIKILKQCGNYFETREKAEKAVDKLKAWKRLRDKGFKFGGWENDKGHCLGDFIIHSEIKHLDNITDDLDLLFGGE